MSINVGQAVAYLDLDSSKFKNGLKSAYQELKQFNSDTASGKDRLQMLGSAATTAGKTLTRGLTLPLAGVGAAALHVTNSFNAGMSKVQAISGATGDELQQLRDKAIEMGDKTKFSATESAEAFSYMAMAGWKTTDMLDGIEGIMNLAAASGEDLATTSDIVTDALTAFGLSAKDSTHFSDVLATASSNANTNVSMMGETFKYVAPVAGAMGYSVEDCATAIGLMANSGIKGSQAGTALRNIFTRLTKPTAQVQKALDELGVSATDSEGNIKSLDTLMGELRGAFGNLTEAQKTQYASTLAGQYGMSGLLAIVNASESDYNQLASAINNADGASQEMADTMINNIPGALTLLKSNIETALIKIGEVITPMVLPFIKAASTLVKTFSSLPTPIIGATVVLGALLAAIGPLLLIFGTLSRSVLDLIRLQEQLYTVMEGRTIRGFIKAAVAKARDTAATIADTAAHTAYRFATSGVGQAITGLITKIRLLAAAHKAAAISALGIIGVIAGLLIYMKTTGTSFSELGDKIINMFRTVVDKLPEILQTVSSVVSNVVKELPGLLETVLPQMIETGTQIVVSMIQGITEALPEIAEKMTIVIVTVISAITEAIPQIVESITGVIPIITESIAEVLPEIIKALVAAIPLIIKALTDALPQIIDAVVQIILAVTVALAENLPQILEAIVQLLAQLVVVLIQNIPTILAALAQLLLAILAALVQFGKSMLQQGLQLMAQLGKGIVNGIKSIPKKVSNGIQKIVSSIRSFAGRMLSAGVYLIARLLAGMVSIFSSIPSKMRSWAQKIPQAIKSGVGSLFSIGANLIQGLWNGLKSKFSSILSNIKNQGKQIHQAYKNATAEKSPSRMTYEVGQYLTEGLRLGIVEDTEKLIKGIMTQGKSLQAAYSSVGSAMDYGLVDNMIDTVGKSSTQSSIQQANQEILEGIVNRLKTENTENLSTLKKDVVQGVSEALEDLSVVLDKRQVGKFTRKAAKGLV